jgi:hypothetical protein
MTRTDMIRTKAALGAQSNEGCVVSTPLPRISQTAPSLFRDRWAQGQYDCHRSKHAPANVVTRHLTSASGEVVGFVSYCLQEEDVDEWINLFASIEAIYIEPDWRRKARYRDLLEPMLSEVESAVRSLAAQDRMVNALAAGTPNSSAGSRVSDWFSFELKSIVERCLPPSMIWSVKKAN